jgi:pimeloyl-ACP methyl ester carboxylesterase
MNEHTIEHLAELANSDPWLTYRGRFLDVSLMLEVGEDQYLIRIQEGSVESVSRGPFVMPQWRFALRASAPETDRWETLWHYSQGGPGVFRGDPDFYTVDGDVRDQVAGIDTSRCPLYLLTGEYDYSRTPDDTRELARRVEGSEITIMNGMGHFPMSEDPEGFLSYLRPVLADIGRK